VAMEAALRRRRVQREPVVHTLPSPVKHLSGSQMRLRVITRTCRMGWMAGGPKEQWGGRKRVCRGAVNRRKVCALSRLAC
jgi:hypothetical protein